MKKLFLSLVAIIVAIASCVFVSCDDDDSNSDPLVGSWQCNNHYYGGSDTYRFKSNGTYEWECSGWSSQTGKYSYNKSLSTLTITNQKGTTWVYVLVSLTESFFVIMDEDGYSYTFNKR